MTTVTGTAQTTVEENDLDFLLSISSTGSQAFNTHYTHKANTRVEMDCEVTKNSQSNWEALFGARLSDFQHNAFCFFSRHWNQVSSPQDNPCFNRTGQEKNGTGFVYDERIKLVCEGQTAKWYRPFDPNTVVGSVTTTGTADDGKTPMLFFNLNTSSTEGGVQKDTSPSVMKLYGCKIYEGSTLKCDFVPASYNGTIGLYDRVNHTFDSSITSTSFTSVDADMAYDYYRALNTIEDGQSYRVFTMYNNQKYYVTANGRLSTNLDEAPLFEFIKVPGGEYEYGFKLKNGKIHFTNPKELDEDYLTIGYLNYTDRSDPRDLWEAQVLFLNTEGKYAIRSTNSYSSNDHTNWGWVGKAFWTVNEGTSGPLAEYSWDMNYVWQIEKWIDPSNTIDLSTLTGDCVVPDNTRLTGTLKGFYKVSIADGATVSFRDVNINIDPSGYDEVWDTQYRWAGITCEGNATIFLENTNTVKGFCNEFPGIYVPEGKTLLIYGSGTLNAISGGNPDPNSKYSLMATGIGGGFNMSCGNIIINEGTITATGGDFSAGIGSGRSYDGNPVSCGNITINGGTVTATSEHGGAGIGSGTGYNGTSTCGDITITGGTVTATGGLYSAGIGSGFAYYASSGYGDITISGGTVTATSGSYAAAIGTGFFNHGVSSYCGDITITDGIEKVVAITDYNFVGEGMQGTCGNVTFGDNLGYDAKKLDNTYYICTIQAADKITYPVWIGETQVTYLNKDDILGDGKASYTPDYTGGTLTFTGTPQIDPESLTNNALIYANDINLTIVTPDDGLTLNSSSYGIWIEGDNKDLTINGDIHISSVASGINTFSSGVDFTVNGKLTINSDMNGVWTPDGDVTINGTVEIEQAYIGIYADNVIVKGSLNAQHNKNRGIHANGNVTIDGDIIVTATGGGEPVAIYCQGDITVVSGTVMLNGDVAAMQAKGTITIPLTHKVIKPWDGQVKKIDNFSYIVDKENNTIAKEVFIELKDCDVNSDGSVTIADALCIVNHVLGNTPEGFSWPKYELNGDGNITIADAVVVVNMILSGLAK